MTAFVEKLHKLPIQYNIEGITEACNVITRGCK